MSALWRGESDPGARFCLACGAPLEPLAAADTDRMLAELLGSKLPPELRELVVQRADGNPFFVEELVATLFDRGVLERENGSFVVHDVPTTPTRRA